MLQSAGCVVAICDRQKVTWLAFTRKPVMRSITVYYRLTPPTYARWYNFTGAFFAAAPLCAPRLARKSLSKTRRAFQRRAINMPACGVRRRLLFDACAAACLHGSIRSCRLLGEWCVLASSRCLFCLGVARPPSSFAGYQIAGMAAGAASMRR